MKPLEHLGVLLTLLALGAAPQPLQRLVEKHPLSSVSTSVGKNNDVHALISQGSKTPSGRGFNLPVEKHELFLGKRTKLIFNKANLVENYFNFYKVFGIFFSSLG